jgi:hypothetical protein
MVLGAGRGDAGRLATGEGFRLAALGIAIRLGGAVAARRLLATVLFEVHPAPAHLFRCSGVPGPGLPHAEVTALAHAAGAGAAPQWLVSTRNFCPACATVIEKTGGVILDLKTAVWGR